MFNSSEYTYVQQMTTLQFAIPVKNTFIKSCYLNSSLNHPWTVEGGLQRTVDPQLTG